MHAGDDGVRRGLLGRDAGWELCFAVLFARREFDGFHFALGNPVALGGQQTSDFGALVVGRHAARAAAERERDSLVVGLAALGESSGSPALGRSP